MDKQVIHFTSVPIPNVEIVENAMPLNVLALQGMFKNQEIQSIHPHAKAALKSFFIQFNKIKTAGGLVYHPQSDSYLWIKRLGLWDLPKGKIEQGESSKDAAIREIIEECGLTGKLSLKYRICSTYHVYEFKNKSILKKITGTIWSMKGIYRQNLRRRKVLQKFSGSRKKPSIVSFLKHIHLFKKLFCMHLNPNFMLNLISK